MPDSPSVPLIYSLDANDFITFVCPNWLAFAHHNHAAELTRNSVLGASLWTYITEPTTRYIYRTLFQQVRTTNQPATVPFRCDGPHVRRFMELRITHRGEGALDLESTVLRRERRLPINLLDATLPRSDELITMCGWCKKVATPDWVDVEQAITRLRLFEQTRPPQITHGICEDCQKSMLDQIGPASPSHESETFEH